MLSEKTRSGGRMTSAQVKRVLKRTNENDGMIKMAPPTDDEEVDDVSW